MLEPETRHDDEPPDISFDEVMGMLDAQRDAELAGKERPLLKRSWIKRQQSKTRVIAVSAVLLVITSCAATVRRFSTHSDWVGQVAVIVGVLLVVAVWWATHRWRNLRCPYCDTPFSYFESGNEQEDRKNLRCNKCRAVMIDYDA